MPILLLVTAAFVILFTFAFVSLWLVAIELLLWSLSSFFTLLLRCVRGRR